MDKHAYHQMRARHRFRFQGLIALLVVALAVFGGYAYYKSSHAAGSQVGITAPPSGAGAWSVDQGGCVTPHGGVAGQGGECGVSIGSTIVGMAAYNSVNNGYWLASASGNVYAFNAPFYGSAGGTGIAAPIVAIAAKTNGGGYWLLGANGAVYSYGAQDYTDARASGLGNTFIAMASTQDGAGYWLLNNNGVIYPYGDAQGGNVHTITAAQPSSVVGIAGASTGNGYWVLHSSGGVTQVGAAPALSNLPGSGFVAVARYGNNSGSCIMGLESSGATAISCPQPVASISVDSTSIAYNSATTIHWSSGYAVGCTGNGFSTGGATSGAVSTGALTATRSYSVTCVNAARSTTSGAVTVNVAAPPSGGGTTGGGTTGGGTTGGGTTGGTGATGTGSTGSGSTGGTKSTSGSTAKGGGTAKPDTAPPSVPTNFTAELNNQVVDLSWHAATDNTGIGHYTLERSLDQATWTMLDSNLVSTNYTDTTVGYGTIYYYRLKAYDQAGNSSDFTTTQITTGAFSANSSADQPTVITSDDHIATVTIPAGATSDAAECSLIKDSNHSSALPLKKSALVAGPYNLLCKKEDGSAITSFSSAATITIKLTTDQLKRYHNFSFWSFGSKNAWVKFKVTYNKKTKLYSFTTKSTVQFVVLGSVKKGLSAQTIILVIMFILAIGGAGYYLYQRAQKANYQEYIRKKYYNL